MQYNNTTASFDYDYDEKLLDSSQPIERGALIYMYVIMYSIIILLGLPLHTLVICMIICKMKKTAAPIWFLGLSITDLVIILFLPFHIISAWEDFTWSFRGFLCKTCSYLMFVNMHSTAVLVALLSVIRCLSVKVFQVCCTRSMSNAIVMLSWFAAVIFSVPSLFQMDTIDTSRGVVCRDTYAASGEKAKAVAVIRFLLGWLCPFCVVFFSSCLVSMKRNVLQIKNTKAYAVIRAMIIAYFLCWLPYHLFLFFRIYATEFPVGLLTVAPPITTMLSFLNSCINPIIYLSMGKSIHMSWMQDAFSTRQAPETAQEEDHSLQNTRRDSKEDDS